MAAATNSKKEAVKEVKAGDLKYQVENLKIALKFSNDAAEQLSVNKNCPTGKFLRRKSQRLRLSIGKFMRRGWKK